ncbi:hypothetical protein K440DRAFT_688416, partial [Wilcoxina mikolae CBS 423.85]
GEGTVTIKSTVWGEWEPLDYIDSPYVGCVVIPWPVDMDITIAAILMQAHGYTVTYATVCCGIRWGQEAGRTMRHTISLKWKPDSKCSWALMMVMYMFPTVVRRFRRRSERLRLQNQGAHADCPTLAAGG